MSHRNVNVPVPASNEQLMDLDDIDYIEMYVGNARQAAFYYAQLYGFRITGYSGLETGNRERMSYLLEQGQIRLVLTGCYSPDHEIADYVRKHGDGVKDIVFRVKDVDKAYRQAIRNGAPSIMEPCVHSDENGRITKAVIGSFGDTVHTLMDRSEYTGAFGPMFRHIEDAGADDAGLHRIDHLAICVDNMRQWKDYYERVFGFRLLNEFNKDEISSEKSALMTTILQNGTERVKLSIIEPAAGQKKSQIKEFLDYHQGPGVQHIGFTTNDIIHSIATLERRGIKFLTTPSAYYEMLPSRVGDIDEPIASLQQLNILVDRDDDGYLLQIFGPPIHDRPTLFFEVIQRKGSRGFGNGNIKALFEAVEREQARRGNL